MGEQSPVKSLISVLLLILCTLVEVAGASPTHTVIGGVHDPVDLIGRVRDYRFTRNWNSYYWREDFSFTLEPEKGGPAITVVSREPTPAYHWRLGTTYINTPVDFNSHPRVRVVGVTGLDRDPPDYYGKIHSAANLVTAHVVWVESSSHPGQWRPFYVNNWFHSWGAEADRAISKVYANQPAPFDIYGLVKGQIVPFSPSAQALLRAHPQAQYYHGLIRGSEGDYSIDLLHLIVQDKDGNGAVVYGDDSIPRLDERKP